MLPIYSLPKHSVHIHSIGNVEFREFTMAEEKILLQASEKTSTEKDVANATQQIIDNCTFGKIDWNKISLYDTIYLLCHIRAKSISDVVPIIHKCSKCDTKNNVNLSINLLKPNEWNPVTIMLTDDIGVLMRLPRLMDIESVIKNDDTDLLVSCVEKIFDKETVYTDFTKEEVKQFLEQFSTTQISKFKEFQESLPEPHGEQKYTCKKCKEENTIVVEGLLNFFM